MIDKSDRNIDSSCLVELLFERNILKKKRNVLVEFIGIKFAIEGYLDLELKDELYQDVKVQLIYFDILLDLI